MDLVGLFHDVWTVPQVNLCMLLDPSVIDKYTLPETIPLHEALQLTHQLVELQTEHYLRTVTFSDLYEQYRKRALMYLKAIEYDRCSLTALNHSPLYARPYWHVLFAVNLLPIGEHRADYLTYYKIERAGIYLDFVSGERHFLPWEIVDPLQPLLLRLPRPTPLQCAVFRDYFSTSHLVWAPKFSEPSLRELKRRGQDPHSIVETDSRH